MNIEELIHISEILGFKTPRFKIVLPKFFKTLILLTALRMIKLTGRAFKIRILIDHLNRKFSGILPSDNEQSIHEHMVKLKGRSGMKKYVKSKWEFKFWFGCPSKRGYLYQMNMYLGKKKALSLA